MSAYLGLSVFFFCLGVIVWICYAAARQFRGWLERGQRVRDWMLPVAEIIAFAASGGVIFGGMAFLRSLDVWERGQSGLDSFAYWSSILSCIAASVAIVTGTVGFIIADLSSHGSTWYRRGWRMFFWWTSAGIALALVLAAERVSAVWIAAN